MKPAEIVANEDDFLVVENKVKAKNSQKKYTSKQSIAKKAATIAKALQQQQQQY